MRPHCLVACILTTALSWSPAGAAETVTFPGAELSVKAVQYHPRGPGPFPAVVALHGCAGLYEKNGSLSPRHLDWAERLAAKGFVVLFPDSFGSRGAEVQCKTNDRVTRPSKERVEDALAARNYLQSRSDVKAEAISLLGWSNGGSTVLYAVEKQHRPRDSMPDFAKAVAFYPGCRAAAVHGAWNTRLPLMILIGAADDWTPAAPCKSLVETGAAASEPVSITVYPEAYHDFDHPNLPVHMIDGLAFTASGNGRAHTGTNSAARQDAIRRVPTFLAQ